MKIDWDTFTYNTSCRRCNYLERLIDAQRKDVNSLQNQIESFVKGNYEDAEFVLESEQLLKSEPVFNKIFPGDNFVDQQTQSIEGSPKKSSRTLEKKYSTNSNQEVNHRLRLLKFKRN